jgi:hypothetical protein
MSSATRTSRLYGTVATCPPQSDAEPVKRIRSCLMITCARGVAMDNYCIASGCVEIKALNSRLCETHGKLWHAHWDKNHNYKGKDGMEALDLWLDDLKIDALPPVLSIKYEIVCTTVYE